MSKRLSTSFLTKIAWLIITLVILSTSVFDYHDAANEQLEREIGFRHLVLMSLVSLPIGPVVLFFVDRLVEIRSSGLYEIIAIWASCVIGGYIQWFYLLPKTMKRVRHRKKV